jgi:hypothetical protein
MAFGTSLTRISKRRLVVPSKRLHFAAVSRPNLFHTEGVMRAHTHLTSALSLSFHL